MFLFIDLKPVTRMKCNGMREYRSYEALGFRKRHTGYSLLSILEYNKAKIIIYANIIHI